MRILQAFAICVLLTACATKPIETVYVPTPAKPPEPIDCGTTPSYEPATTYEVDPTSIKDQTGTTWVALTPEHYRNLSLNYQSALAAMKGKNSVIAFYRDCLKAYNQRLEARRAAAESDAN